MKNETIQIKQRTSSYGQINAEVIGDWDKLISIRTQ